MQLREAAQSLGVHYQTAYSWVRAGILPARKTPAGYQVSEDDVRALARQREAGTAPRQRISVRDWTAQAGRLFEALAAGDEKQARQLFGRLGPGVPVTDLCDLALAPALRRIGSGWADGSVTVGTEHRATAICERLIASVLRRPEGRPRGIAITATPPGERHGLPALMATACLREDRWQVHHLGPDLPVTDIAQLARTGLASLIILSAATEPGTRQAQEAARQLRRDLPGVTVLAGHPGGTLRELRGLARAAGRPRNDTRH